MPRGLDHIVHAVRDLDAAAELYRGLGFTVGARNRHPRAWGTQNHIIQLPDTFIELLAVTDPDGIAPHGPRQFSFGAFNRDFLEHGQGLSMLVLKGSGARDSEDFRTSGIGDFDLYNFDREGKRPVGTPVRVAFKHANGAMSVAGAVAVASEPARHRNFLECFAGAPATACDGGFAIATPRGTIEMIEPADFLHRYGVTGPDVLHGARLAALRFATKDASLLQGAPEFAGLAGLYAGNAAVIGPEDAMGAVLVFEPAR
jgi:hypothetical protein